MTTPATDFIIVGRVRKAHGIRGAVVVEPITDEPGVVFAPGRRVFAGTRDGDLASDGRELRIAEASPFKGGLIVSFEGIADRSAAELWRDRYLLLPRDELPPLAEGEIYLHELLGMRAVRETGEPLGDVVDIFDLPQGIALDIRLAATGRTVMLLYDRSVTAVNREQRVITVEVPTGMLD